MITIETILHDIEMHLSILPIAGASPQGLYAPISYALDAGGKRIRPLLCCVASELFCGDYRSALIPALALELYHNHTLLHDDLMDDSSLRRGSPTVYYQWGINTAVLSGDAMLITAFDHLFKFSQKDILVRILPTFSQMCLAVCEGQQYDMEFEKRDDVKTEEYLGMISLKTSALIACSLRIGAMVGKASDAEADLLYELGMAIGQAFQLEDDLLDVFGTEAALGKPIGGDIVHNKKTILLTSALDKAQGDDASELKALLSLGSGEAERKIRDVCALYVRLGVDTYTRALIDEYESKAFSVLDKLESVGRNTSLLRSIVSQLSRRNK